MIKNEIPVATRVHEVLKAAVRRMTAAQIADEVGAGEGAVVNALNALRTEKKVDGDRTGNGKKKSVMAYWAVDQKDIEVKERARALKAEIISAIKDNSNGEFMTAAEIAKCLTPKVSSTTVAQRLSGMYPKPLERMNKPLPEGVIAPGGRTTVAAYRMADAHQAEQEPVDSEGGHADVKAVEAPTPEGFELGVPLLAKIDLSSHFVLTDAISTTAHQGVSALEDIRHVAELGDDIPDNELAQALQHKISGLQRRLEDKESLAKAIALALHDAGVDLLNQTPVEGIQAIASACAAMREALGAKTTASFNTEAIRTVRAVTDLQAIISGTGAELVIMDGQPFVEVLYGNEQPAVARPGDDLLSVLSAIRVLARHNTNIIKKALQAA